MFPTRCLDTLIDIALYCKIWRSYIQNFSVIFLADNLTMFCHSYADSRGSNYNKNTGVKLIDMMPELV